MQEATMAGTKMRRVIQMATLILAGEMIFGLPFHTARFFRPTFLDVFGLSNTNLGDIFAAYGVTAMIAYFPGGLVADRFSARKLLTVSLVATGAGGLFMSTIPSGISMSVLYAYWGVTTILLFWAPMLKATRQWGGALSQGRAFGILDGGRGLVAAAFAVVSVTFMAFLMPENLDRMTLAEQQAAFRSVILLYSAATALLGLMTWYCLPDTSAADEGPMSGLSLANAMRVLGKPIVWAKAGIIVFAYCGYKGLDNLNLYAVQVLGMDEVEGARFFAYVSYLRPVAAIVAGIIADRFIASRTIALTFTALTASFAMLYLTEPAGTGLIVIYGNIFVSAFGVFAIRGIYFALLEETNTPPKLTGTTIGIMSFVGYTPEIFFAPIAGRILDASPGVQGHQNYYLFLAVLSCLGLAVVLVLMRLNRRRAVP